MIQHKPSKHHNPKKHWGRIHVYTGEGKGKTTAALGLGLRAMGHGYSVMLIQFLKNHKDLGEIRIQPTLSPYFRVYQFGQHGTIDLYHPSAVDMYYARQGLDFARRVLQTEDRPHLLILDEINVLLHYGLLSAQELLDFLDNKPQDLEMVLTGRYAPEMLLQKADLVTEMSPVKHYFDEEFEARRGLEH